MKVFLTAFLFCSLLSAAHAQHPDDYRWDDRFGAPGIVFEGTGSLSSPIFSTAIDGDDIYVGGQFTSIGNNIALWNVPSKKWHQLGSGVNGNVKVIRIVGDEVYVGGTFTQAGGVAAENIAVWHKSTQHWSALGQGVNGSIVEMEFFRGELHIAGSFSTSGDSAVNSIARWSGGEWKSLGEGIECGVLFGMIECMTVFQNTLWVGGTFEIAGGKDSTSKIAFWDGTSWNKANGLSSPANYDDVRDMASVGGTLFVAGSWDSVVINNQVNKVSTHKLLAYDGVEWSTPIQSFGFGNEPPILTAAGQYLYVAANFTEVNGILAQNIACWNSTTKTWSALGSGIKLWSMSFGMAANDSIVVLGGRIPEAGGQFVNNIAFFNIRTNRWSSLVGSSTLAPLHTIGEIEPLITDVGDLLVVGDFRYAGDVRVNGLARWDGTGWKPIASGLPGTFKSRAVIYNNMYLGLTPSLQAVAKRGNSIILGGDFDGIGQTQLNCLAEFRDGVLSSIGGGVSGAYGVSASSPGELAVESLLADSALLYVGGKFKFAGTTPVNNIAIWNGNQWNDMAGGLYGGNYIPHVAVVKKAPNGDIYVGGTFTNAGGVTVNGIARWDGQKWHAVGQNAMKDEAVSIYAMAFKGNDLYVAGFFKYVNGTLTPNIAKWDGQSWTTLGSGVRSKSGYGLVRTLAIKGDELYVGGIFDVAGDIASKNIAVWNTRTNSWSALGSGVSKGSNGGHVNSIVIMHDTVFCGGIIDNAGGKPSFNIAAWLPATSNSIEYISTVAAASSLSIQPNPTAATATITFTIPQAEHVSITLRDALGREVQRVSEGELQAGEYQTHIDCSTLAVGAYYCVMTGLNGMKSQMLVITR